MISDLIREGVVDLNIVRSAIKAFARLSAEDEAQDLMKAREELAKMDLPGAWQEYWESTLGMLEALMLFDDHVRPVIADISIWLADK